MERLMEFDNEVFYISLFKIYLINKDI